MRIAVDLDDVLCDLRPPLLHWYNQRMNTKWTYDDFTKFNLSASFGITPEEEFQSLLDFHEEFNHTDLPVMQGSVAAIARLAEHHELYVVTSRPIEWKQVTEDWVEANFPGRFKEIHLANPYAFKSSAPISKGQVCKELGCKVLIDDDAKHLEQLTSNGIDMIIMTKPWNSYLRLPPHVHRVEDWSQVETAIADLSQA